ncbi:hypothetical protein [Candidatus Entotheonella palauensis]|uniref:hypothetical protein n=1 Tax=Candidatus Entotheonella palauensis TaxID=93172 RepID=UPI000B7FDB0E|nr:hypothetical protein [Candidatus Entotheonella palauensis]
MASHQPHFCGQHLGLARLWVLILVLCMPQMSTTLRPILGRGDHVIALEKKFFLHHWLDELEQIEHGERSR